MPTNPRPRPVPRIWIQIGRGIFPRALLRRGRTAGKSPRRLERHEHGSYVAAMEWAGYPCRVLVKMWIRARMVRNRSRHWVCRVRTHARRRRSVSDTTTRHSEPALYVLNKFICSPLSEKVSASVVCRVVCNVLDTLVDFRRPEEDIFLEFVDCA